MKHTSKSHFLGAKVLQPSLSSPVATEAESVNESEKSWLPDVLTY